MTSAAEPTTFVGEVSRPIQKLGAEFYFVEPTLAHGKSIGLGGLRFYFMGRGGALGDVNWQTVHSAFGYFNPTVVEHMWTTSLERIRPTVAAHEYALCSQEFGRTHFSDLPDLDGFCAAAESVIAAVNPAGLALFAGMLATPLASDPAARAYQLVTMLREHRGSAHLLAIIAVGLSPRAAHAIKRPNELELFGWTPEDIPELTEQDKARHSEAEQITDALVGPAFDQLDESARNSLRNGLASMRAALQI